MQFLRFVRGLGDARRRVLIGPTTLDERLHRNKDREEEDESIDIHVAIDFFLISSISSFFGPFFFFFSFSSLISFYQFRSHQPRSSGHQRRGTRMKPRRPPEQLTGQSSAREMLDRTDPIPPIKRRPLTWCNRHQSSESSDFKLNIRFPPFLNGRSDAVHFVIVPVLFCHIFPNANRLPVSRVL